MKILTIILEWVGKNGEMLSKYYVIRKFQYDWKGKFIAWWSDRLYYMVQNISQSENSSLEVDGTKDENDSMDMWLYEIK